MNLREALYQLSVQRIKLQREKGALPWVVTEEAGKLGSQPIAHPKAKVMARFAEQSHAESYAASQRDAWVQFEMGKAAQEALQIIVDPALLEDVG